MVVFGQKWLYSGKSCCIREKVNVIGEKRLYSGKVVVLVLKWFSSAKWLHSGKSG